MFPYLSGYSVLTFHTSFYNIPFYSSLFAIERCRTSFTLVVYCARRRALDDDSINFGFLDTAIPRLHRHAGLSPGRHLIRCHSLFPSPPLFV